MPNLDFYIKDNGRVEYSKDLSVTQYSTGYMVRLLTKNLFHHVDMLITTGDGIKTDALGLTPQPRQTNDGFYHYDRQLGLNVTGYEFVGDKSILKVAFKIYPDTEDPEKDSITTSLCYVPLLKSNKPVGYDDSVTYSELANLQAAINELNITLENLGLGELDTAKNYDQDSGNIKATFDELLARIQNNANNITAISNAFGNLDLNGQTVDGSLTLVTQRLDLLNDADANLLSQIQQNAGSINTLTNDINTLREALTPLTNAGLKYRKVDTLPASGENGVVYLVRNEGQDDENNYIEYLWVENHWEILGTSRPDLQGYTTTANFNALQSLVNNISSALEQLGQRVDTKIEQGDLAPYATKAELSGYVQTSQLGSYATDSELQSEKLALEGQISNVRQTLEDADDTLQSNIDAVDSKADINARDIETLETNLAATTALAQAMSYAESFSTKAAMDSAAEHINPNWKVGTSLFIKEANVPDYWVSAVYDTPRNGLYYELTPMESKLDLYYTKDEVDATTDALDTRLEAVEGRYRDQDVDNLLDGLHTTISEEIAGDYLARDAFTQEVNKINDAITDEATARQTMDDALDGRIDTIETGLASEISRAQATEAGLTTSIGNAINTSQTYTNAEVNKIKDGTYIADTAKYVQDYADNTKKLRFASDSNNTDFLITDESIDDIHRVLSWLAPNQYN